MRQKEMASTTTTATVQQHTAQSKREHGLMIVERRVLTRWGVRIETRWTNASGSPETHVRMVSLKPVGVIRTWLIERTAMVEQELLVRWLLSWLVASADAVYATEVIDTYVINTPVLDGDEINDDAAYACASS
jgi:hypothetical protein